MQPPIHVTANPQLDWIIFFVVVLLALYWLRALRLAREGARRFFLNVLKAIVVGLISTALFTANHIQPDQARMISVLVGLLSFSLFQGSKRSRYIPAAVKREVIKRDLKGKKYNPRKHHIDHVWPFSRGGSHAADNLRVLEKKENLKKGAKRPGLRDMW